MVKEKILEGYNRTIFGKLDRSQVTIGEYIPYKLKKEDLDNATLSKF